MLAAMIVRRNMKPFYRFDIMRQALLLRRTIGIRTLAFSQQIQTFS
jgi:hypothetical protein